MAEDRWNPCGVVSLLTDFGLGDPYVGVMKGVILSRAPGAVLVDLCHGVPAQGVAVGAWFLARSREHFPPGTVHVAVVDPGVGSGRRLLAALDRGQAFLAPDNGLLGPSLTEGAAVVSLDVARFALPGASSTFHGRDVLAPAAAALAGGLDPRAAGSAVADWRRLELPRARARGDGGLEVEILFVDRFGNLVTTFDPTGLEGWPAAWTVEAARRSLPVLGTYSQADPGRALALVGSSGTLEVSVRDGDAARELGLGAGGVLVLRRRST